MNKMRLAIQCTDGRTNQTGSFCFRERVKTILGDRFYSLTPVFKDLVELFDYTHKNGIEIDHSPANYEDVPYRGSK